MRVSYPEPSHHSPETIIFNDFSCFFWYLIFLLLKKKCLHACIDLPIFSYYILLSCYDSWEFSFLISYLLLPLSHSSFSTIVISVLGLWQNCKNGPQYTLPLYNVLFECGWKLWIWCTIFWWLLLYLEKGRLSEWA